MKIEARYKVIIFFEGEEFTIYVPSYPSLWHMEHLFINGEGTYMSFSSVKKLWYPDEAWLNSKLIDGKPTLSEFRKLVSASRAEKGGLNG